MFVSCYCMVVSIIQQYFNDRSRKNPFCAFLYKLRYFFGWCKMELTGTEQIITVKAGERDQMAEEYDKTILL